MQRGTVKGMSIKTGVIKHATFEPLFVYFLFVCVYAQLERVIANLHDASVFLVIAKGF